jgi:hypothetical protein
MHLATIGLSSLLVTITFRRVEAYVPNIRRLFVSYSRRRLPRRGNEQLNNNKLRRSRSLTSTMAARTALDEHGDKGEFVRKDAAWRNWVKNGTGSSSFLAFVIHQSAFV